MLDLAVAQGNLSERFKTLFFTWMEQGREGRVHRMIGWEEGGCVASEDKQYFCNHIEQPSMSVEGTAG